MRLRDIDCWMRLILGAVSLAAIYAVLSTAPILTSADARPPIPHWVAFAR